jgi:hypothetical protein
VTTACSDLNDDGDNDHLTPLRKKRKSQQKYKDCITTSGHVFLHLKKQNTWFIAPYAKPTFHVNMLSKMTVKDTMSRKCTKNYWKLGNQTCLQSRKLGIWIHRTFGPVNCEELQDRTRFYRTDNKIMILFLNNKFILFKCHILIALSKQQYLQLDSGVKVSVRVLMGSCSCRVRPKTMTLVYFASLLST